MTHGNAPLSVEGRRRLVTRCQSRPIAHVAPAMGVSRACASKWVNRFRRFGELGLQDRSSAPSRQPTATPAQVVTLLEAMRRDHKWSAARIAFELGNSGVTISRRTVSRRLLALELNRRRFIDPDSPRTRTVKRATAAGTRAGYVYLHFAVDGYSRLTYTDALGDEKATTAIGFMHRTCTRPNSGHPPKNVRC